jgi:hypothetical protein
VRLPRLDPASGTFCTFRWNPPIYQKPGLYEFTMSVSAPLQAPDRRWFEIRVLPPVRASVGKAPHWQR